MLNTVHALPPLGPQWPRDLGIIFIFTVQMRKLRLRGLSIMLSVQNQQAAELGSKNEPVWPVRTPLPCRQAVINEPALRREILRFRQQIICPSSLVR